MDAKEVKIRGDSRIEGAAGSIACMLREGHPVMVRSVGANACYRALCAVIMAGEYLVRDAICFDTDFGFVPVTFDDGQSVTGVCFMLNEEPCANGPVSPVTC